MKKESAIINEALAQNGLGAPGRNLGTSLNQAFNFATEFVEKREFIAAAKNRIFENGREGSVYVVEPSVFKNKFEPNSKKPDWFYTNFRIRYDYESYLEIFWRKEDEILKITKEGLRTDPGYFLAQLAPEKQAEERMKLLYSNKIEETETCLKVFVECGVFGGSANVREVLTKEVDEALSIIYEQKMKRRGKEKG